MSLRDEIDRVIEEEGKKDNRVVRRQEIMSKRKERERARLPPTYLAVLIGKILYKFHRPPAPRKPVTPKRGIEGYVEREFIEKPKVTPLTIIKEDLRELPRKLLRGGLRKKKPAPQKRIPTSNETIDDWKDFFDGAK